MSNFAIGTSIDRSGSMLMPIDPERSMMMISAALGAAAGPSAAVPPDLTVTIALTSRARTGRYSFWKTSTVKSGAVTAARSLCFGGQRKPGRGKPELRRTTTGDEGDAGVAEESLPAPCSAA